jgi:hypothetical protein
VSILEGNKHEPIPLNETTRGTLDESNYATPEDNQEMEPKSPTPTQVPIGGPLGE